MSVEITTLPGGSARHLRRDAASRDDRASASGSAAARGTRARREHGLSHFLEHMAFKGTRRRSARAHRRGDRDGRRRPQRRDLDRADRLLRPRARRRHRRSPSTSLPTSSPTARSTRPRSSARSRSCCRRSRAVEDTPDDLVFELLTAGGLSRPGRSAGRSSARPTTSARFSRDAIDRLMSTTHYRADNMIVAAAGAVEHERFVADVARHFGDLGRRGAGAASRRRATGAATFG